MDFNLGPRHKILGFQIGVVWKRLDHSVYSKEAHVICSMYSALYSYMQTTKINRVM